MIDKRTPRLPKVQLPIWATFLLVAFSALLLYFVTGNQLKKAQNHRLRLLAGLGQGIETLVPELASRFVTAADEQDREAIQQYLDYVPSLKYLDCEVLEVSDNTPAVERARSFTIETRGPDLFLAYRVFQPDPGCGRNERSSNGAPESSPEGQVWVTHRARIELDRLLRPILIPEIFDAILVADEEGDIFFQEGVPEVRVSSLDTLLASARPAPKGSRTDSQRSARKYSGSISNVFESHLSDAPHHVFFQPATIRLPASLGYFKENEEAWIVCGIVSRGHLLSSSLATSPLLLFGLVAIFPLAFVAWPFLKLWLISPRQRFTRFDVAALALSSIIGLALLTLAVFAVLFVFNLSREVDGQIEDLSSAIYQNLRMELFDAHEQLDVLDRLAYEHLPEADRVKYPEFLPETLEKIEKSQTNGTSAEGALIEQDRLKLDEYPLLHSVFWIDKEGRQLKKLPLRRYATLAHEVQDRDYFRCVGNAEIVLELDEEELGADEATRLESADKDAAPPVRREFCVDSVRSKTTAEDLAVIAKKSAVEEAHAVALVTELHSVTLPILPPSYAFAVLDGEGEVMFHSDRRRNRAETFLNACDYDSVLGSLLESRRRGHLDLSYLGQPHRAHVRPVTGTPWSLIVMRRSEDLRLRAFELIYDFLNPFGIYLPLLFLLLGLPLAMLAGKRIRWLWPSGEGIYAYRMIVLLTPVVLAVFAVLLELAPFWIVFVASLAGPAVLVVLYQRLLIAHDELRACFERPCPSERASAPNPWLQLLKRMVSRGKRGVQPGFTENSRNTSGDPAGPVDVHRDVPDLFSDSPGRLSLFLTLLLIGFVVLWTQFNGLSLFLIFCILVIYIDGYRCRKFFEGEQRRIGYTFAFSCVLFSLSVLPAFGFLSLAISRQTQLAVADEQVSLAQELEERWARLQQIDRQLAELPVQPMIVTPGDAGNAAHPGGTVRYAGLQASQERLLGSYFDTRMIPAKEVLDGSAKNGSAENRSADGGQSRSDRDNWLNKRGFVAKLMASRWISFNDLSFQPAGIDLSRFELAGHSWALQERQLTGTLGQRFNAGEPIRLASELPQPFTLWNLRLRTWVLWVALVLLLPIAPWLCARMIAEKVLLIKLVPTWKETPDDCDGAGKSSESRSDRQTLEDLYEDLASPSETTGEGPSDLIAITSVPALAIQPLIENKAEIVPLPGTIPEEEDRKPPFWQGFLHRTQARSQKFTAPLVVTPFRPHLHDAATADRQLEWLAEQRKEQRPVLIVSRTDPRTVLAEENEDLQGNGDRPKETLRRRWASFLATFVIRYVLDTGDRDKFERAVEEEQAQRGAEGNNDGLTNFEVTDLLETLKDECRATRQLQKVGYYILSKQEYRNLSHDQLLAHIGFLARSYYQAIWAGCDTDEKCVLAQLAEEGVVNPKSYDRVHDLMQKGLIVRDPDLRLMNESFRRYIRRAVRSTHVLRWEQQGGPSAWSVLRWLLPLPLLLLGVFLFVTQRDAVSNVQGVVVALGSLVPTLYNLYGYFQRQMNVRRDATGPQLAGP